MCMESSTADIVADCVCKRHKKVHAGCLAADIAQRIDNHVSLDNDSIFFCNKCRREHVGPTLFKVAEAMHHLQQSKPDTDIMRLAVLHDVMCAFNSTGKSVEKVTFVVGLMSITLILQRCAT